MIPTSVAGAVFVKKSVLLILRRDVPVWVLPGGGIDPGETPEEAILREIVEETGLRVNIDRLAGAYTPINRLAKPTHLYQCSVAGGSIKTSPETKAVRFFPMSELPPMPPPYAEWVADANTAGPTLTKRLSSVSYAALLKHSLGHPLLVLRFLLSRLGLPINS